MVHYKPVCWTSKINQIKIASNHEFVKDADILAQNENQSTNNPQIDVALSNNSCYETYTSLCSH